MAPDIKPRSRDVTDGLEKTAARGMLRAVGMGDEDFAKPQIGVASSWNEITPCNLSLDRLADAVKSGNTTLITNAMVYKVLTDPSTGKASGVMYVDRVTREVKEVKARVVILCAQALESARILLNSAEGGLANSSGVLGHYLMDHLWVAGGAAGEFGDRHRRQGHEEDRAHHGEDRVTLAVVADHPAEGPRQGERDDEHEEDLEEARPRLRVLERVR